MITRIEIDGFKSFRNFAIDLKPFQIFIGANGVGKSNFFDAIVLLSRLAGETTLYEAFRENRGEIAELFTLFPTGERAKEMKFAVDMLIDKTVVDDFGVQVEVSSTRLRYELTIERRDENTIERLYVTNENLFHITEENDTWYKRILPTHKRRSWIVRKRNSPYISTANNFISRHQDKRQGARQETPIGRIERTILSTVTNAEYPTAYAARQEMLNWRFFQFDPTALRSPSSIYAPDKLLVNGSNLASVLNRMDREDEYALADVSLNMTKIIPGIVNVDVETLRERQEHLLRASTEEGSHFSSQVLSDGTLRILALVTLKSDPHHYGVLCFEEPENGVHPTRLGQIVELLQELSTNFQSEHEANDAEPLRQVLINTHSPKLLSYTDSSNFVFVYMTQSGAMGRLTRTAHVTDQLFHYEDEAVKHFTVSQIHEYLNTESQNTQIEALEGIRASL